MYFELVAAWYCIYCCLNIQPLLMKIVLILLIASHYCYCSQALCTGIEKLTCPKVSKIGQMDQSLDSNNYTHIETHQLFVVVRP